MKFAHNPHVCNRGRLRCLNSFDHQSEDLQINLYSSVKSRLAGMQEDDECLFRPELSMSTIFRIFALPVIS